MTPFVSWGRRLKDPSTSTAETAEKMLRAPLNVNGRPNSDVVRPVRSGVDLVRSNRGLWTIDFDMMSLEEAAKYEYPFEYVKAHVKPERTKGRRARYAEHWWRYGRPRVEMRQALTALPRYFATPATAKHRIFVWVAPEVLCNQGTLVFARADDYFFGILHSALHEVWALQTGTQLEDRPRYTPVTTFATFPFPGHPEPNPPKRKTPALKPSPKPPANSFASALPGSIRLIPPKTN